MSVSNRVLSVVLASFLTLAVGGCTDIVYPEGEPQWVGEIAVVGDDALLLALDDEPCGVMLWPLSYADILVRGADGRIRRGVVDDLVVGAPARAWGSGNFVDTCPMQHTVHTIEVERP